MAVAHHYCQTVSYDIHYCSLGLSLLFRGLCVKGVSFGRKWDIILFANNNG